MEKEITRRQLKHRQECLSRYNRWEAKHRCGQSAGEAVRRIGYLYEMIPQEARKKDYKKKTEGIRQMHEVLIKVTGEGR